jgi:hypothetical protein
MIFPGGSADHGRAQAFTFFLQTSRRQRLPLDRGMTALLNLMCPFCVG